MKDEIKNVLDDHYDGIAMIFLRTTRLNKGLAHCLTIFHKGDTLLLETLNKTSVRHSWQDPVDEDELHKLREIENREDLEKLGNMKLESILDRELPGRNYHLSCHYASCFVPQDHTVFNHCCDEKYSEYCWKCGVSLRRVKKSLCAGCLKARYCTLECQSGDRDRHRDYCMKMKAKREEKKMSKVKKVIEIDWEQEVD